MSIFQKSATISFSDFISQSLFSPHRESDDYQGNEMLVGLNGGASSENVSLFDESFADNYLMRSFVEGNVSIEERVR